MNQEAEESRGAHCNEPPALEHTPALPEHPPAWELKGGPPWVINAA